MAVVKVKSHRRKNAHTGKTHHVKAHSRVVKRTHKRKSSSHRKSRRSRH